MKFVAGVILASVIAVCTAVLPAAQAPQKPAQPPQQPTFKAGVSFVSVDAYPTLNGQIVGDLKQDEFEVLEDGVPQRIETFEHVVPRPAGSPSERGEPSSQAESDEMAADPRVRLFVLFFDTLHMAGTASPTGRQRPIDYDPRTVGRALVTFLDALIGPDDLIGLMQPRTPVDTLLFTRRPSSFETFLLSGADFLKRYMEWEADDTEREYTMCYPREDPQVADVASNMIARRREVLMIDGLRSLTTHLQNLREGRKAVIVISEGWTLFKPDRTLERGLRGQMPGAPPLGIKGGQPVLGDPNALSMMQLCERDRLMLARIDNELEFRQLLQDANRANVTFYPVSPRGLTAESTFNRRSDSLTTLATATDGVSLDTSNDFAPVLKRIRDDVSSYYLLGYNSTNANFDGKFRAISVRVRRPGVTVRARPGYTAPTAAEIAARAKAAEPRDPVEDLRATALGSLGTERADRPFRIAAGYGFEAADPALRRPGLWVVGELDGAAARSMAWSGGGEATVVVGGPDGQVVATQKAAMTAATPRFSVQVSDPGLKPGDYLVKVRLKTMSGGAADESAQVRVTLPDVSGSSARALGQPMLFRRGPYSGAGFQPTADLRFRKAERIRVDVPVGTPVQSVEAQLLDRKGQPLPIPVTAGQREEGMRRFITAEITLAPLAAADYLVEVSARRGEKTEKMLVAFRIVP